MSSALSTFASATPFAKELSRPPKQPYALSSAAADKTHALYSAANVPGSRAIQRGDSKANRAIQRSERTRLTRYSARGLPSEDDDTDDELSLSFDRLFNFSTNACSFEFSLFSDCFSSTAFLQSRSSLRFVSFMHARSSSITRSRRSVTAACASAS